MKFSDRFSSAMRTLMGTGAPEATETRDLEAVIDAANAQILRPLVVNEGTTVSSSDPAVLEFFSGDAGTAAGKAVTPDTAMKISAVYACTRLQAGAVATLPLPVYELDGNGDRQKKPKHPVWRLLNTEPTPAYTAASWLEYVIASILLRGDQFNCILRARNGAPGELVPMPSAQVIVEKKDRRLKYYWDDEGKRKGFDQDDVLHFPGFGFNGLRSMSVIRYAAYQSIGTAIAMEEFAGKYFVNGALQKFVLESPNDLDDAFINRLRERWNALYAGIENSHKPLVLYNGLTAKALSMSAEDTQLLESRRFQVEDIARAFGVPPHMIGLTDKTTSWGAGVEAMGLGFLIFTLAPHLTRIEQEINRKLLGPGEFCEFNRAGILQADTKGRSDYLRQAIGGSNGPGWMSANEVRRVENLPKDSDPASDKRYVPSNTAKPEAKPKEGTQE